MSRKSEILKYAEEQKRLEAERKRGGGQDKLPRMNSSHMPFGCWMFVLFALWGLGYLILRALKD